MALSPNGERCASLDKFIMHLPSLFSILLRKGNDMERRRVYVRAYLRIRFGVREFVRAHTRRWPQQLSFDF